MNKRCTLCMRTYSYSYRYLCKPFEDLQKNRLKRYVIKKIMEKTKWKQLLKNFFLQSTLVKKNISCRTCSLKFSEKYCVYIVHV